VNQKPKPLVLRRDPFDRSRGAIGDAAARAPVVRRSRPDRLAGKLSLSMRRGAARAAAKLAGKAKPRRSAGKKRGRQGRRGSTR
jgi:hypothetical protein